MWPQAYSRLGILLCFCTAVVLLKEWFFNGKTMKEPDFYSGLMVNTNPSRQITSATNKRYFSMLIKVKCTQRKVL